ncbi:MFS transporter [Larkinella soli]|uniref:MFS transporter n=1 Tax=Larkinella soli TaxID=1770527 RepID=UPI000FFB7EB3|nr:MFS transporter [Larkinella soli]
MLKDRRLLLIYAIVFVDVVVGSAISPILPDFVKGRPEPQLWLAVGTALFLGIQLFSAPLLGKLSDSIGRRPVMRLAATGTFLADLLLLPIRTWAYLSNRLSDGLTNGMYATVRSAIADISPKEDLFRNMGIEGTIVSFGFVLGPMVSGLLLTALDVPAPEQARTVVQIAIGLSALNLLLSFLLKETHRNRSPLEPAQLRREVVRSLNVLTLWNRLRMKDRDKPGLMILVVMQICLMMSQGYYFYFVTFISLGPLHLDARGISFFFMYFGLLSVVINFVFYTYLADRIDQRRTIVWFALAGLLIHVAYANVGTSLFGLYAIVTVDCLTISLIWGLLEGLTARLTTDDDRGEIFGINQALNGLASFTTTVVFGGLSILDLRFPFYWFALCIAAVGALAWWKFRPVPNLEESTRV